MKWIDTRTRVPDDATCVIVASSTAGEALVVAYWGHEESGWFDMHGHEVPDVDFWMTLPELPGREFADN